MTRTYIIKAREITDTSIGMRNVKGNARPRTKVLWEVGYMVDGEFRQAFGPTDKARATTWMDGHNAALATDRKREG